MYSSLRCTISNSLVELGTKPEIAALVSASLRDWKTPSSRIIIYNRMPQSKEVRRSASILISVNSCCWSASRSAHYTILQDDVFGGNIGKWVYFCL